MTLRIALGIFLLAGLANWCLANNPISIQSPNGQIQLTVTVDANVSYSLTYKGKSVIMPSTLGFTLQKPAIDLRSFELLSVDSSRTDETWTPIWGEESRIRNNHHQLVLHLKDNRSGSGILLDVVFRVFNEGVGFRYAFPQQPNLNHFIIANEHTQFAMAGDHTMFWIPGDYDTNEYAYYTSSMSELDASGGKNSQEIYARHPIGNNAVQTPLMLKSKDALYINIHEAALSNYPAMNLELDKKTRIFQSHLVPDAMGNKAYLQAPAATPWRTIIVSDKAGELLTSRMILNLNEPSRIQDPSWIKPQKFVGVWWEMHVGVGSWDLQKTQAGSTGTATRPHSAHTANVKRYIDFAAKHGIPSVLVEGWNTGWEDWFGQWEEDVFDFVTPYPDFDLMEITRYARSKGVKLIMHHETSASVTNYERQMDTAYRFMKQFGYDAVKTGYVGHIIPRGEHHDGQWMVRHYERVAQKTANYRIMVDAHEPVRPTGLHRTYPNWLACEAARGNEFNAWSNGNMPEHETILPFTRLMGGPMDYTPGIFKIKMNQYDPNKKEQVHTTLSKQLALYVTLYSPLQMAADLPENYEAKPDAFQFIKDVAVDWDKTVVPAAEPGDYIVMARKAKGSPNWFIGAITDENARQMKVSLDFLEPGKSYIATIYRDADSAHWNHNPEAYVIEQWIVNTKTSIKLKLAAGGGTAISLVPITGQEAKSLKRYR